jgi:tRNA pseudouridine38-40 synthase
VNIEVAPAITRVRFTVSYDGTDFCGWQKQKHGEQKSVGHTVEDALSKIFDEKIHLFASGRTDAGVHALNQVCHFDTTRDVHKGKAWDFCWAVNSQLPSTIVVKKAWIAPSDFHATLSATHKTYRYWILSRPRASALMDRYIHWTRFPIDIAHLQASSQYILGIHDFKSFQSVGTIVKTTTREIYKADWSYRKPGLLEFKITGSGFLKQMVRNIVGTQLMLEKKKLPPQEIQRIIQVLDRAQAGAPAPAKGLMLERVYYPQDLDNKCLEL